MLYIEVIEVAKNQKVVKMETMCEMTARHAELRVLKAGGERPQVYLHRVRTIGPPAGREPLPAEEAVVEVSK